MNAIAFVVLISGAIEENDFAGPLVFISAIVTVTIANPRCRGALILTVNNFAGLTTYACCRSTITLVVAKLRAVEINSTSVVSISAIVAIAIGEPIGWCTIAFAVFGFA